MNPNQYPPQPGQQPPQGYPPQQGGYNYPPQQPGGYQQPQPGYGPQPGQQPVPQQMYGPPQPGYGPPQMPTTGYNPYPYPGENEGRSSKGPNKLIFGVVAVIIIVGILFAVLSSSGGGNTPTNQTSGQNPNSTSKPAGDVVPRSDGRLDLASRVSLSQSLKAQSIQAKIREQINLSSGFSFMVTKLEDYVSTNPATVPAAGKKFVVVTAVAGNRNNTSDISVSYLDFRLRDPNNTLIAGSVTTNEILDNPLSSPTELKPGEQLTGKVIFEVSSTDTNWVFKHSETYQKTTDNTNFIVEGEITLQTGDTTSPATTSSDSAGTTTSPATGVTPTP